MGRHKKYLVIMLALIMPVMALLAACGGSGAGGADGMQQNVTVGKRVFVHEASGVVYFGYKNLICTAVMKDGEISEFVPEGGTTGNIHTMAVYGDYLYISASDGMFKYPLSMFTDGSKSGSPITLIEPDYALSEFTTFEIFEDKIFFIYGTTLCCMPADGGDRTPLADEVADFEVTDKGIYYVKKDGEMMLMSPDLEQKKAVGEISTVRGFNPGGMRFYYNDGSAIRAFSVEKEESEDLGSTSTPSEYCLPWSDGDSVLFYNKDFVSILLKDGKEKEIDKVYEFPLKAFGTMYGDCLVYERTDYKTLEVYDLDKGTYKSYDLAAEMKEYLDKLGKDSDPEPQPQPEPKTEPETGTGDYDIMKSFMRNASADTREQYMYFNDFLLIMPNDSEIGFQGEGDHVDFMYLPGRDAGYGGNLMTIKAYDLNDDSYKNLPSYHVAGIGPNVNKRFVVIYPTDLQCDPNDSAQVAKYKELHDYVMKINEGSTDGPFYLPDSDPER